MNWDETMHQNNIYNFVHTQQQDFAIFCQSYLTQTHILSLSLFLSLSPSLFRINYLLQFFPTFQISHVDATIIFYFLLLLFTFTFLVLLLNIMLMPFFGMKLVLQLTARIEKILDISLKSERIAGLRQVWRHITVYRVLTQEEIPEEGEKKIS